MGDQGSSLSLGLAWCHGNRETGRLKGRGDQHLWEYAFWCARTGGQDNLETQGTPLDIHPADAAVNPMSDRNSVGAGGEGERLVYLFPGWVALISL